MQPKILYSQFVFVSNASSDKDISTNNTSVPIGIFRVVSRVQTPKTVPVKIA